METSGRGRSQGLSKIFRAAIYRAHRAVVFAIAQLSCCGGRRNFPKDFSISKRGAFRPFKVVQGHPRSMILVPIESAVYDILLVGHCDYGPYLAPFSRYGDLLAKMAYFCYPSPNPLLLVSQGRPHSPPMPGLTSAPVNSGKTSQSHIVQTQALFPMRSKTRHSLTSSQGVEDRVPLP